MAYAETTVVSVEKSISEIIALIKKAGANRVAQAEEPGLIAIQFFLEDRMLRFSVQLAAIEDMPAADRHGYRLDPAVREKKRQQRHRQRARALLLVIKAKLESVESGVETFEEAFLANVVMPDGRTVGQMARPQIAHAYETGEAPAMFLLGGPGGI